MASHLGLGGLAQMTNLIIRPSQMRKRLHGCLLNDNWMYSVRPLFTYASVYHDNRWSYVFALWTPRSANSYVEGVSYTSFGYFATL